MHSTKNNDTYLRELYAHTADIRKGTGFAEKRRQGDGSEGSGRQQQSRSSRSRLISQRSPSSAASPSHSRSPGGFRQAIIRGIAERSRRRKRARGKARRRADSSPSRSRSPSLSRRRRSISAQPRSPSGSNRQTSPYRRKPQTSKLHDFRQKRTIDLSTNDRAVKKMIEIKAPSGPQWIPDPKNHSLPPDYAALLSKQSWLQRMSIHGIFSIFENTQYMILHHLQNRIARETSLTMASLREFDKSRQSSPRPLQPTATDTEFTYVDTQFDTLDALFSQ